MWKFQRVASKSLLFYSACQVYIQKLLTHSESESICLRKRACLQCEYGIQVKSSLFKQGGHFSARLVQKLITSVMSFWLYKVVTLLSLWMKSYSVTIQMKVTEHHCLAVLFFFRMFFFFFRFLIGYSFEVKFYTSELLDPVLFLTNP